MHAIGTQSPHGRGMLRPGLGTGARAGGPSQRGQDGPADGLLHACTTPSPDIGVSNFDVPQMQDAWNRHPFQSLQPPYNLFDRGVESSILPYCARQRIGVLAHSPLAKGLLTLRYRPGHVFPADDERSQMPRFQGDAFRRLTIQATALNAWAQERGHTLLELAIAWVLSHSAVPVSLCGAKSADQVDDHIRAVEWQLSDQERRDVERVLQE
jgi:aryl-alcohol dehydrogenase-like predicted oxidoreductase